MRIIDDEYALPAPDEMALGVRLDYIRSESDPSYLIAGKTGETYIRRDGHLWEWPGYEITRETDGRVSREPATGKEALRRYPMADTAKGLTKTLRGAA